MALAKIETPEQNARGQALYPKLGFQEVARQIHYVMPLYADWFPWWPVTLAFLVLACVLRDARRLLGSLWWWIPLALAPVAFLLAYHLFNPFPFDTTVGPGYVWHCHILDHEDNDMMRPMKMTPPSAVAAVRRPNQPTAKTNTPTGPATTSTNGSKSGSGAISQRFSGRKESRTFVRPNIRRSSTCSRPAARWLPRAAAR